MKHQRGFLDVSATDIAVFVIIVALMGWGIGSILELAWPYVGAFIHEATDGY